MVISRAMSQGAKSDHTVDPEWSGTLQGPPAGELVRALFPSPIGEIGLCFAGPLAVHVEFTPSGPARKLYMSFEDALDSEFLAEAFGRLSEYFAGARPSPEIEVDFQRLDLPPFAKRVLKETAKIPFGRTRTYRRIAAAAGKPEAYRVVLAILAANPLPILVPCHRVVTHKSGIGSYIGGRDRKRWLLSMEKEGLRSEFEE